MDAELTRIDSLLTTSEVEQLFIRLSVERLRAKPKKTAGNFPKKSSPTTKPNLASLCAAKFYAPSAPAKPTAP